LREVTPVEKFWQKPSDSSIDIAGSPVPEENRSDNEGSKNLRPELIRIEEFPSREKAVSLKLLRTEKPVSNDPVITAARIAIIKI